MTGGVDGDVSSPEQSEQRVRKLSDLVANQIAAGEVVARPASVVKELVENAIDAGAGSIRVEIAGGGARLVRIIDDGCGMAREDAVLALERHATSKLRSADDLRTIGTLGFRGEALPSIASVSRFSLSTRRREDDEGTRVVVVGGGPAEVSPCGGAAGTTIEVADLFFNVPARRKFLRALGTEAAHVTEALREAALARPEIQLELVRDGRSSRPWLRAASRRERVLDVLGAELPVSGRDERGPLAIEVFLSLPEKARSGATGLRLLINGRPVQDRGLARAAARAYGDALDRGAYPVGAIYVDMPGELCDVNVHPQKAEVRFTNAAAVSDAVYSVVKAAVTRALGLSASRRPAITSPAEHTASAPDEAWTWVAPPQPRATSERPSGDAIAAARPRPAPAFEHRPRAESFAEAPARPYVLERGAASAEPRPAEAASGLRFLAQVARGVLLACDERSVLFLDRREIEARVIEVAALKELEGGRLVSQRLLFPARVDLPTAKMALLETATATLERLGFDARAVGPTTAVIHAAARVFSGGTPETVLGLALADAPELEGDPAAVVRRIAGALASDAPLSSDREASDLVARWDLAGRGRGVLEEVALERLSAKMPRHER